MAKVSHKPPPSRNATVSVRMRVEEKCKLQDLAYSHKMMLSEWARGVLLRELAK